MRKKYKHIIWDWNGTLMKDTWLCVESMNQVLADYGKKQIDIDFFRAHFDLPVDGFYAAIGFDPTDSQLSVRVSEEYIKNYNSRRVECGLQEDAHPVLGALQSSQVEQSVLSAYRHSCLNEIVGHYEILPYLRKAVGVDNVLGEGKIVRGQQYLKELLHHPEEILLVGDMCHDVDVAKAMGVDCLLVDYGHQNRQKVETAGVPVASSLVEVREHIL